MRRLGVLIRHLPGDAALVRAVYGPAADWGPTEHLLAIVVDLLAAANWQRGGDKTKPRPKPIERPGSDTGRRRLQVSGREMQQRLLDQQARHQEGVSHGR